jgi:hypothetical protein
MKINAAFRRAVTQIGLIGLLQSYLLAAPIAVPEWVKPIEHLLPQLPPEVISEVDDIYAFQSSNQEELYRPGVKEKFYANFRRQVELREQLGLAMGWVYLKSTVDPSKNYHVLVSLRNDRALAATLLPIVRFRIEWLKQIAADERLKQYLEESRYENEFADLRTYLLHQGEIPDLENFNMMIDGVQKLRGPFYETPGPNRLQTQIELMEAAKVESENNDRPYWLSVAQYLIDEGHLDATALNTSVTGGTPSRADKPQESLGLKLFQPNKQWQHMWVLWLSIGVVSVLLFGWAFRKPR